jgi:hypothetical protein
MAGNTEPFFLDESLNEVIQHRMNGKDDVGLFSIEELTDELAGACVEEVAFVRPTAVDEPVVPAHPLWASRQDRVVKGTQGPIELAALFEGFSD